MAELILGGARSGKSRLAELRAEKSGLAVVYVATTAAGDEEMTARIDHHRGQRPGHWSLVEEPLALAEALRFHAAADRCLLVDCLTLWISNLLMAEELDPGRLAAEQAALIEALPELPGRLILVSNEVGMGIVPDNPLARRFRDEAGRLHQRLGEVCGRVTLVVAGLPLELKGS